MSENPQASLERPKECVTTPKRPVICPDCGTEFSRQPDMSRHIIPKITCPVGGCHKPFRKDKENEFMIHVEREHPRFDSQVAKGHFKARKDESLPLRTLCTPGDPKRIVAEPHIVQTPAHQPRFSVMPAQDRSLDDITLSHDPSLSSNTYDGALPSFGFYNPSSWQDTMSVEDSNLGIGMFGPLLEELYHNQHPSSPADPRFTQPK